MADPTSIVYQMQRLAHEDAILNLPFDGDLTEKNGDKRGIESGGLIFPSRISSQIGSSAPAQFAEAVTNHTDDPQMDKSGTGEWTWAGSGSAASKSTAVTPVVGSQVLKYVPEGADAYVYDATSWADSSLVDGKTFTMSVWVYLPTGTDAASVALILRENTGSGFTIVAQQAAAAVYDQWQRIEVTGTFSSGLTSVVNRIEVDNNVGNTIYIDACQFEESSYATPFCSGALGDGHSWAGTAHASKSSRTAANFHYDNDVSDLIGSTGSLFGWFRYGPYLYNGTVWEAKGADNNNRMILQNENTGNANWGLYINGAWRIIAVGPSTASWGEWVFVCITWDFSADDYNLIVYDSGTKYSDSSNASLTVPTLTSMRIGGRTDGSLQWNGWIDDFIILDKVLTSDEIALIYEDGFAGVAYNGAWEDISADVVGEVNFSYGIESSLPQDRQAGSGIMNFKMNNSATNSAGLVGYYSPNHANARENFDLGTRIRIKITDSADGTDYYKFVGFLDSIRPTFGANRDRITECSAVDWLDDAARLPINARIPIQEGKTGDQLITQLLTAIERQPEATDLDVGEDVFNYGLDTGESNRTTILREFTKIVDSELGYGYVQGNTLTGGVLTLENRHARVIKTASQFTLNEGMISMRTNRLRDRIKNLIRVKTHPRDVDTNPTSVLSSLDSTPQIRGGASLKLVEDYRDENNASRKAGGTDIQVPIPGTDYTMNTEEDGGGSDITYDQKGKILSTENADIKGYWPLDEDVGSSIAKQIMDVTGADDAVPYSGVVFGATGIGDGRTAINVDGTGWVDIDSGDVLSDIDANGELFTFLVWAKIGSSEWTDGSNRELFRYDNNGTDNVIIIRKSSTNNEILFYYEANGTASSVTDTSLAGDTGWHMYAITVDYSNDRMRAYIDGAQVGGDQTGLGQWSADTNDPLAAAFGGGLYTGSLTEAFIGDLAHGCFWAHELTAAELLAIYNAQTGGFNVDWNIGGFAVEWNLTNQETSPGYVTKLELKGKLVRDFDPVTQEAKDETSLTDYGELILTQDMPLQEDPLVGKDAAEYLLTNLKNATTDIEGVEYHANRNATYLTAALAREPGDRITLTESITGFSSIDFFINGVSWRIIKPDQIFCTWYLVPADDVSFWAIGTAGFSEIGESTYVSY